MSSDSTNTEQSRYSVTDYFEKYPSSKSAAKTAWTADKQSKLGMEPHYKETSGPEETKNDLARNTISVSSATPDVSQEERFKTMTPQHQLYQGTELDTSLSTIRESDDVVSVISSAVTSVSVTSIDDRDFREGLANLDANIARIQASLKEVMDN